MDLEGVRHEGIVVYSASSSKLLINWSDGPLADKCVEFICIASFHSYLSLCWWQSSEVKFGRRSSSSETHATTDSFWMLGSEHEEQG